MTRVLRLLAASVVVALALVACGRTTTTGGPTLPNVYSGGVKIDDVRPLLDDSSNWWPGAPQFGVRPLDSSTRPDEERFDVTVRFFHNGSAETLNVVYRVWFSTSLATAIVTTTEQAAGTSSKGPTAGDQSVYLSEKLAFGAAPYVTQALIRVGQTVISVTWSRAASFASTNAQGAIAKKVVSKLKGYTSSTAHASPLPAPDPRLLPPDGQDVTKLGADKLPIEVVAQMVAGAEPTNIENIFKGLGANDFVFGDYALNADTHMEVQTAAFTFSGSSGAKDWLDQFIGKSNLDSTGGYFNYDDLSGQYIAAFGSGSTGAVMICRSAAELEAASRACETPMGRVASSWRMVLGG